MDTATDTTLARALLMPGTDTMAVPTDTTDMAEDTMVDTTDTVMDTDMDTTVENCFRM